jgi:hypothetical protein
MKPRAGPLYELVGLGMAAYGQLAFRTEAIGLDRVRLAPGTVLVAAHLSDADVPVVAGAVYRGARLWRSPRVLRPGFAVSNDLLDPGFLAGYPPGLPIPLRRLLWPLAIRRVMRGRLRCLPIRFTDRARLVEVLRHDPGLRLDAILPPAGLDPLLRRAARLRRPIPVTAGDVLEGGYADLLWTYVRRAELDAPALASLWARRLVESSLEVRALGAYLSAGGSLVLFPHGQPSADGSIAELDARAGRLVHRLARGAIQPLGLAYDPLVRGRPRAFVAGGAPLVLPSRRESGAAVIAALRAATPLTAGHLAAELAMRDGSVPGAGRLAREAARGIAAARERGRPVEPALLDPRRADRLAEARAAVERLGARHPIVARTALTYATALDRAA